MTEFSIIRRDYIQPYLPSPYRFSCLIPPISGPLRCNEVAGSPVHEKMSKTQLAKVILTTASLSPGSCAPREPSRARLRVEGSQCFNPSNTQLSSIMIRSASLVRCACALRELSRARLRSIFESTSHHHMHTLSEVWLPLTCPYITYLVNAHIFLPRIVF